MTDTPELYIPSTTDDLRVINQGELVISFICRIEQCERRFTRAAGKTTTSLMNLFP